MKAISADKADIPQWHEKYLDPQIEYGIISGVDSAAPLKQNATARYNADDPSFREYVCNKLLFSITLGLQYTHRLNLPTDLEKASSFKTKSPFNFERSKFWAVLVGIDAYESYPLRGCVSDALLVKRYLKEDLGIPQERMQLLLGSQHASPEDPSFPSRANIINTLLSLVNNPQVKNGDNIIFYFSGHGSGYFPSDYYLRDADSDEEDDNLGAIDESIEAICPIDRDTIDSRGLRVPDISDREINAIFQQISHSKGHRITFILDSCHSGSHARHFPEPGTRTIPPLPRASLRRMLHMADETLGQYPSYQSVLSTDWQPDMSSHVILAACKEYQIAKEVESETGYNGVFTQALIGTLRSENLREESTYVDLLFSLPLRRGQTPVVAGKHKCDRLWYKD
ncbi:caspase domain-containing protein [Desarmillaria ectypa]|nr:caspase domain-containing protein [Desarmillaria ectypa]